MNNPKLSLLTTLAREMSEKSTALKETSQKATAFSDALDGAVGLAIDTSADGGSSSSNSQSGGDSQAQTPPKREGGAAARSAAPKAAAASTPVLDRLAMASLRPAIPDVTTETAQTLASNTAANTPKARAPEPAAAPANRPATASARPIEGDAPRAAPAAAQAAPTASRATTETPEVREPHPVLDPHLDPGLRVTIGPQAAQIALDSGESGALYARLRISNGIADVHLTGDGAQQLARHTAELSLGLTAAGLQPGRVDVTAVGASADTGGTSLDQGDSAETAGEDQADAESGRSQPRSQTSTQQGARGQVHIKA